MLLHGAKDKRYLYIQRYVCTLQYIHMYIQDGYVLLMLKKDSKRRMVPRSPWSSEFQKCVQSFPSVNNHHRHVLAEGEGFDLRILRKADTSRCHEELKNLPLSEGMQIGNANHLCTRKRVASMRCISRKADTLSALKKQGMYIPNARQNM